MIKLTFCFQFSNFSNFVLDYPSKVTKTNTRTPPPPKHTHTHACTHTHTYRGTMNGYEDGKGLRIKSMPVSMAMTFHTLSLFLSQDKKPMFHFWFNTYFLVHPIQAEYNSQNRNSRLGSTNSSVSTSSDQSRAPYAEEEMVNGGEEMVLELKKDEIDKANKDKTNKIFSPNLKVLTFSCTPRIVLHVPPSPAPDFHLISFICLHHLLF